MRMTFSHSGQTHIKMPFLTLVKHTYRCLFSLWSNIHTDAFSHSGQTHMQMPFLTLVKHTCRCLFSHCKHTCRCLFSLWSNKKNLAHYLFGCNCRMAYRRGQTRTYPNTGADGAGSADTENIPAAAAAAANSGVRSATCERLFTSWSPDGIVMCHCVLAY